MSDEGLAMSAEEEQRLTEWEGELRDAELPTHPPTEAVREVRRPGEHSWVIPYYARTSNRRGRQQRCEECGIWQTKTSRATECPGEWPDADIDRPSAAEVRRDKPELIVAAIEENLRAVGEDSLTELGWLPPAAHVQLRSDLAAMTSDRDWLRSEFEEASAELARLRDEADEALGMVRSARGTLKETDRLFHNSVQALRAERDALLPVVEAAVAWRANPSDPEVLALLVAVDEWQSTQSEEDGSGLQFGPVSAADLESISLVTDGHYNAVDLPLELEED